MNRRRSRDDSTGMISTDTRDNVIQGILPPHDREAELPAWRGPRAAALGWLAAYLTLNEALTDTDHITRDVKAGFLVRTRADADTVEARKNDTARREKALASGAQYVSTDYMEPDTRFGPYRVGLRSGAIAECNPQRAPERCAATESATAASSAMGRTSEARHAPM